MKYAAALVVLLLSASVLGQEIPLFTEDLPPEEFQSRREKVYAAIGDKSFALIQGAPSPVGYVRFRQSNTFYYLCGVETPHAYLLLDGTRGKTSLYLPHRNEAREASEGKLLSAEDAQMVQKLTGVDAVHGSELLSEHLARAVYRGNVESLFTPFQPAVGVGNARDMATRTVSDVANDPWDGRPSREAQFIDHIRSRFPQLDVRDLSAILDKTRLIKSPREIKLIERATRLSGLALMEAARSTEPGLMEQELDGLAKFIFYRNGAQGNAYYSLVASGRNAWYPHYHRGQRQMKDDELLLMDCAPDYNYYVTDVTRMWPVSKKFNEWQRQLYGFYLACYEAILRAIRPGEAADIKREAASEMERFLSNWVFSKPSHRKGAEAFVKDYRESANVHPARLGHWVGMAPHDVGPNDGTLRPGMVLTIEPALRVPEEHIYIRLEDLIVITEEGAEVLSNFVPRSIEGIEALRLEEGLLQRYPHANWKPGER